MTNKNQTEYILSDGQNIFEIDYDEGLIKPRQDLTLDDLQVNNDEYRDLEEFSLYEYLESNGYEVDENRSVEEEIFFKSVQ